jgi:pyridoxal phosphate enzyme (YggS family)
VADFVTRVREIRRAIDAAAIGPVDIMAVTKYHTPEEINTLAQTEIVRIGENRVQEFMDKRDRLNSRFEPHIIGQLQRNKVKYIMRTAAMIESVDRVELALEIDRQAQEQGVVMPVLLQVNLAREPQKGGVHIEDFPDLMARTAQMPGIRVKGLMAIMPNAADVESLRPLFREMRALFERERDAARSGVDMEILSMGMTHDYLIAVSEGATQVRLGHAIFD